MKNLMDVYLSFTERKIKKYMKLIFNQYYDENIVNEYLRTYINARYYNIINIEKPARAFYLRILDELDYKEDTLMEKCEKEAESLSEKQQRLKVISTVKEVFGYILFFDNVRNIENFKTIGSIKEIVAKALAVASEAYGFKVPKDAEDKIYKEIKSDLLSKDLFLDKFDTDEFMLNFENSELRDDLFFVELLYNVKMPMQYSSQAVAQVFSEGIIAEDKLQVEYLLMSSCKSLHNREANLIKAVSQLINLIGIIVIRDIVNGSFKDTYIAEFAPTLFKKKQKLDSLLSIIDNQALQSEISLNIMYSDYIKNKKSVFEYTKKGFNFTITLDNSIQSTEDVEELKMFKIVIAQKNLVLYRDLKNNKTLFTNVVFK